MPPLPTIPVEAVPYLDTSDLRGRRLVIMPHWDGSEWHCWLPADGNQLIRLKPADAAHSDYVAKSAAREDDLYIPFLDLMWQRATWDDIVPRVQALHEDFHHLFSSVAKLRFFHRHRLGIGAGELDGFFATELEYMATVARSVFDLVHEVIARIWTERIRLVDAAADGRKKRHKMPRTFSGLLLRGSSIASAAELEERYALPHSLAMAYVGQAPLFGRLRALRDNIVHGIARAPRAYVTPKGFAVERGEKAFLGLVEWRDEHAYNERLVSLLPLLSRLVFSTIDACTALMVAFTQNIQLPPPVAPGHRVYLRTPHGGVVVELLAAARGEMAWWPDEPGAV